MVAGSDGPRGPRGYDEINQAKTAGNFGWPYFIANNLPYADVNFETGEVGALFGVTAPLNESPNSTGEKTLPPPTSAFLYYPYSDSPEFPELNGAGGRTACAGPEYHYSEALQLNVKFPKEFDRSLFIYEWSRHWIKAVHMDENNDLDGIEPFMPEHKFVRPIDMAFGPEGALYVIEYDETCGVNGGDTRLIRIDYVRGNRTPVVVASVDNNIGKEPLTIAVSSAGTFDKDAKDALKYEWRLINTAEQEAAPKIVNGRKQPASLDPDSPGRVSVNVVFKDGPQPSANPEAVAKDDGPLGLRRMKSSDCFNCHAVDQKRVGPPLLDIANKYRDKESTLEASIERVMKGSTGAWEKFR